MNGTVKGPDLKEAKARIAQNVREDEAGCWIWTGTKSNGSGVVMVGGKRYMARRLAYLAYGLKPPLQTRDYLLVRCEKRDCINPACIYKGKGNKSGRPAGHTSNRKYPWHEWLQRDRLVLKRGRDFDVSPEAMRDAVYKVLTRHGKRCTTRIDGTTLTVEVLS